MYTTIRIRLASSQTAIAVVAILGLVCTTHAQNIIMFDAPNSGGTIATAINSTGQITGYYQDTTSGITHGFLRETDGTIITFDGPPLTLAYSDFTVGLAINSASQIAGYFQDTNFVNHGFLRRRDGTLARFRVPNASATVPVAINSLGQITGYYLDATYAYHGFLRQTNGTISTLDVPNATL